MNLKRAGLSLLPALVFALSLSVVSAGPAFAYTWYELAIQGAEEAAPAAGEEIAAGSLAGPEGTAGGLVLATGTILVGAAWATKDTWLPWVDPGAWTGMFASQTATDTNVTLPVHEVTLNADRSMAHIHAITVCANECGTTKWPIVRYDICWTSKCSSGGAFVPTCVSGCGTPSVTSEWTADVSMAGINGNGAVVSVKLETNDGGSPGQGYTWTAPWSPANTKQVTTVTCKNALTGAEQNITSTLLGEDAALHVGIPSCQGQLGPQWWPETVDVTAGTTTGAQQAVVTMTTPQDLPSKYAQCWDPSSGAMICTTKVWINGQPCHVGQAGCVDWQQDAKDVPEDQVQCKFGPYVVPLSDCEMLKKAYAPTTTGTAPTTKVGTDPTTGQPVPQPDPNLPNPNPTAGPSTGTLPTTGPNPSTPPAPGPGEGTNPASDSCWGTGWSWNPISWVYVPVTCALAWAFVPPDGTDWGASDLKAQIEARPPGSLVLALAPALTGFWSAADAAGGCGVIGDWADTGLPGPHQITCEGIRATPGYAAAYTVGEGLVWVGAAYACWRLGARSLGSPS